MTHIYASDLEHLSEQELRSLYNSILDDLIRSGKTIDECPLIALSLSNIRRAMHRRKPKGPGM